jgi:hypothetical protein
METHRNSFAFVSAWQNSRLRIVPLREKAINLDCENYSGGDGCDDAEPLLTQRVAAESKSGKYSPVSLSHNCQEDATPTKKPPPLQYIK